MKKVLFSLLACAMLFMASCASEGMQKLEEVKKAAEAKDFAAMTNGVNELIAMKNNLSAEELVGTAILAGTTSALPDNVQDPQKVVSYTETMIDLISLAVSKDEKIANEALKACLSKIQGLEQFANMDCKQYIETLQTNLDIYKANLAAQAEQTAAQSNDEEGDAPADGDNPGEEDGE